MFATTVDCSATTLWDLSSGAQRSVLSEDKQCLGALAFSPDGNTLVTLTKGGSVLDQTPAAPEGRVWDVPGKRVRVRLQEYDEGHDGRVAFSADGKTIATSGKGGRVVLWDPLTGRRLVSLPGLQKAINGSIW